MATFDDAINYVLKWEGGESNDSQDRGGTTKFGISLALFKLINPTAMPSDIHDMTLDEAKAIYKKVYWNAAPFSQINNSAVCYYIFDFAVTSGLPNSVRCTQRAIHAVSKATDLKDDGIMGAVTMDQINHCGFMILPALRAERANFYREIVQHDPSQIKFLTGWLNRAYQIGIK